MSQLARHGRLLPKELWSGRKPPRSPSTRWLSTSTYKDPTFFSRVTPPKKPFNRRLLLLVPFAGGVALYLDRKPASPVPALLSSPTIIPKRNPRALPADTLHPISSPSEPSILDRIIILLRERIYEPLLTSLRFVHLFTIFMPVIITSPMLLVGVPERKSGGERWGAVWWYGFLVRQMQRAGPTFIKVRKNLGRNMNPRNLVSVACSMGSIPIRPLPATSL